MIKIDQISFDQLTLIWELYISIGGEQIKMEISESEAKTLIKRLRNLTNQNPSILTDNYITFYTFKIS